MSAIDKLRSFAESKTAGITPLQDGALSYQDCRDALAAIKQAQAWKQAVDDLLATWYTTADSYATPREAVKALISFEVMTALDPKVSSDVPALVEQARKEEREVWSKWADAVVAELELRAKINNDPYLEISRLRFVELDTLRARKP